MVIRWAIPFIGCISLKTGEVLPTAFSYTDTSSFPPKQVINEVHFDFLVTCQPSVRNLPLLTVNQLYKAPYLKCPDSVKAIFHFVPNKKIV